MSLRGSVLHGYMRYEFIIRNHSTYMSGGLYEYRFVTLPTVKPELLSIDVVDFGESSTHSVPEFNESPFWGSAAE